MFDRTLIDGVLRAHDPRLGLAGPEHADSVAELMGALAAAEWKNIPERLADNMRAFVRDPGTGFVVLAVHEGEARGFAVVMATPLPAEGSVQLGIDDIYVLPVARGQGLGRAMVEGVLSVARALDAAYVYLHVRYDNSPARRIYEKAGMICVPDVIYEWTPE